jgi:hypothetical protein
MRTFIAQFKEIFFVSTRVARVFVWVSAVFNYLLYLYLHLILYLHFLA